MVVHPFDRESAVDVLPLVAKLRGRFDGNDLVATSRKFCSIAARARPDVKHRAWRRGEKVQQVAVDLGEGDALVL